MAPTYDHDDEPGTPRPPRSGGGRGDGGPIERGLAKLFNLFSEVREGEALDVALLLLNIFLLLVGYYIIKTVREPLILQSGDAEISGPQMKAYAAAAQAMVLVALVPAYSWLGSRVNRMKLIVGLTLFFVACIEVFFALGTFGGKIPFLGFAFFVWVGIFSVSIIAQFWSYANDLYTRTSGERLFPVIAIGATVGAPVGSALAGWLFDQQLMGPYAMMQLTAGILLLTLILYLVVERRDAGEAEVEKEPGSDRPTGEVESEEEQEEETIGGANGFTLIFRNRYLWWITLFLIILNLVNTTGEFILATFVDEAAQAAEDPVAFIGAFYGAFYSVVNVVTILIQAFLVSRIIKYLGMKGIIFALPVVALGTYGVIAAGVGLTAVRWAKTAENATDYSIMNTGRALLWLVTSREEQYKAKQAVDTFFVRVGDVLSAGLVFLGTEILAFAPRNFAMVNLVLIVLWFGVGYLVWRDFERLAEARGLSEEELTEEV